MAFDGTEACWLPDIPSSRDDEWRLHIANFSDGYSQRMLDGINALNVKWSLVWENREQAVVNAMVDYLVARQAKAFPFKDEQTGVTYNVFCDAWHVEWALRRKGPAWWGTLQAEFVKANGVTVAAA